MATTSPQLRFTLTSPELGSLIIAPEEDPIGWEALGLEVHRDPKLHGMTTEHSAQLGFVKRAKNYLERMDDLRGVEADVTLLIELYDANSFLYLPYFTGRLAFRARQRTALEFRCNVENGGITQAFLNQADKQVDLFSRTSLSGAVLPPLDVATVQLHSKAIVKRYAGEVKPGQEALLTSPSNYVTDGESRFQILYFGVGAPTVDEFGLGVLPNGPFTVTAGDDHSEEPIYTTKEAGPFAFDIALNTRLTIKQGLPMPIFYRSLFHRVDVTYYFRINLGEPEALAVVGDTVGDSDYSRDVRLVYEGTKTLAAGDDVYLYALLNVHDIFYDQSGPGYSFEVFTETRPGSTFTMEAQTTTDSTPCAGLLAYEALNRTCQALTDQQQAFHSDFFGRTDTVPAYAQDGEGSLLLTTGGFQVRGFPLPGTMATVEGATVLNPHNKTFTTSWQELYGSLAAIYWLGVGIETVAGGQQRVRVESVPYFYSDEVVVDFTEPYETTNSYLEDWHYNRVELGYQKWQTEQLNGLDEFNTRREWSLPLTQVKNGYSAICTAITSGFYLENTRRQRYDAAVSADSGSDTDTFLICLLRRAAGGFETERNQLFAALSGLFSPETAYNVRLSPARMLRHHARALVAGLQHELAQLVRFTFGEGNNAFSSRLATEAQAVAENANVPLAGLPAPLWLPESYEIKPAMRPAQVAALLANPCGRIRFRNEASQVCEGWVLDFKHNLQEQEGDFTLLRCAQLTALPT